MTRFGSSKFSVGANSAEAQRNYAENYDRIFGGKKYLHVIDDHEIDEIVAKAAKDPLKSLSPEDYGKLPPLSEETIQAALDKGHDEAFPAAARPQVTAEERQQAADVMARELEMAKGHGHDLKPPTGLAFECRECGASFAVLGLDQPGPWTVFQHSALGKPCVKSRRAIQVGA